MVDGSLQIKFSEAVVQSNSLLLPRKPRSKTRSHTETSLPFPPKVTHYLFVRSIFIQPVRTEVMDSHGRKVIIVDNGTGVGRSSRFDLYFLFQFVKCGYAGTNFPEFVFPSAVGRPLVRSSQRINNIQIKVGASIISILNLI